MTSNAQLKSACGKQPVPLLFGKRHPLTRDSVRQYAGTDTERDIKS